MTTTAPHSRPCKYTVGQAVEVDAIDFKAPGMPHFWAPGVVVSVTADTGDYSMSRGGLWDVHVKRTDKDNCWSPQTVGARGGNKNIRPAAVDPHARGAAAHADPVIAGWLRWRAAADAADRVRAEEAMANRMADALFNPGPPVA